MKVIRQSLLAILALQALTPLASAQSTEATREYGVNLGLNASRSWTDRSYTDNGLNASGSLLFLNEHFHVGPTVGFSRSYGPYFDSTSWGLGIMGKWTYENIQTADRTPFVEVSASLNESKGGDWKDTTNATSVAVGYETFLNRYVSLAPSIIYSKSWSDINYDSDDGFDGDDTSMRASAGFRLGLNVYL